MISSNGDLLLIFRLTQSFGRYYYFISCIDIVKPTASFTFCMVVAMYTLCKSVRVAECLMRKCNQMPNCRWAHGHDNDGKDSLEFTVGGKTHDYFWVRKYMQSRNRRSQLFKGFTFRNCSKFEVVYRFPYQFEKDDCGHTFDIYIYITLQCIVDI